FYLMWPFIIYFLSRKSLKTFVLFLIVFIPVFRLLLAYVLAQYYTPEITSFATYRFTVSHLDAFAIGGALTLFNTSLEKINSSYWSVVFFLLCLFFGAINLLLFNQEKIPIDGKLLSSVGFPLESLKNFQHVWSYTILNLFFAALILFAIKKSPKILSGNVITYIGKVSYGIYVFHLPIIMIFSNVTKRPIFNDYVSLALCFGITVLVSSLSYHFFEQRFLNFKSRFK
ncbi:MAG: acyltransferase family protein, partial [Chitinophagaceae bacterium]